MLEQHFSWWVTIFNFKLLVNLKLVLKKVLDSPRWWSFYQRQAFGYGYFCIVSVAFFTSLTNTTWQLKVLEISLFRLWKWFLVWITIIIRRKIFCPSSRTKVIRKSVVEVNGSKLGSSFDILLMSQTVFTYECITVCVKKNQMIISFFRIWLFFIKVFCMSLCTQVCTQKKKTDLWRLLLFFPKNWIKMMYGMRGQIHLCQNKKHSIFTSGYRSLHQ